MADEQDMTVEKIKVLPFKPAEQAGTTPLGFDAPRIRLVDGRNSKDSVPTRERAARLQDADVFGHMVLPNSDTFELDAIAQIKEELAAQRDEQPSLTTIVIPTADNQDDHNKFGLGTPFRRAQSVVVGMYSYLHHFVNLRREDLDRLLVALSSSETRDSAMQEIKILEPIFERAKKERGNH